MFGEFDFSVLDDPDFKEDAVREELITPLLKGIGYSVSGINRIIRSKTITHPYVYIGSKQHKINIIPDYLLKAGENHNWILDAKAPNENILSGKNPEQAFSYAIHPEIRANYYALCNGRDLVVFHISKIEPVLHIRLVDIKDNIDLVIKLLSPQYLQKPHLANYSPDYGIYMVKSGWKPTIEFYWYAVELPEIVKLEDKMYTSCSNITFFGVRYAVSLDYSEQQYQQLISTLHNSLRLRISEALKRQPFKIALDDSPIQIGLKATIGNRTYSNDDEDYIPLVVHEYFNANK